LRSPPYTTRAEARSEAEIDATIAAPYAVSIALLFDVP
jgi:hypothetical protein